MYFVTKDGRVLNARPKEECLEVSNYPIAPIKDNLVGYVSGYEDGQVTFEYVSPVELDENTPTEVLPQPTDTQLVMQAFSDAEIRDFEAQEERKMLAQQMADIELAVLGGGTTV